MSLRTHFQNEEKFEYLPDAEMAKVNRNSIKNMTYWVPNKNIY
jgi:hypothetical protein